MKIQIESYETTYTVATKNDDLPIEDYIDIINNMLLNIGFHQDTIIEGFEEFITEKKS